MRRNPNTSLKLSALLSIGIQIFLTIEIKMYWNRSALYLYMGLIVVLSLQVSGQNFNLSEVHSIYRDQFLLLLGDGRQISEDKLQDFFTSHSWRPDEDTHVTKCLNTSGGLGKGYEQCLLSTCLSAKQLSQRSQLPEKWTDTELCTLSWMLFHMSENHTCSDTRQDKEEYTPEVYNRHPKEAEVWGFGFLCATIIVLCAIGGLVALPFIHGVIYQKVLIFMVGLAVGTLSGSALLVLAPEALQLEFTDLNSQIYLWKCLVMLGAIYTFFLLEKALKLLTKFRKLKKEMAEERRRSLVGVINMYTITNGDTSDSKTADTTAIVETGKQVGEINKDDLKEKDEKEVAPVAWMILLGDGVHNFIDGVSLGAAFTESVSAGVSVSVAIVCEELPHELGDFAVLLTAGMSKKKATFFNILSGCTIYLGMVLGIFVGENEHAHTWVFAFAAGMFLYIALVDMMPEMIRIAESKKTKELIGGGMIFLLQNIGLLVGFGAILTLAIFGGDLDKAITKAQL